MNEHFLKVTFTGLFIDYSTYPSSQLGAPQELFRAVESSLGKRAFFSHVPVETVSCNFEQDSQWMADNSFEEPR
jgi:hypothetical protein